MVKFVKQLSPDYIAHYDNGGTKLFMNSDLLINELIFTNNESFTITRIYEYMDGKCREMVIVFDGKLKIKYKNNHNTLGEYSEEGFINE